MPDKEFGCDQQHFNTEEYINVYSLYVDNVFENVCMYVCTINIIYFLLLNKYVSL